MIVQGQTVKLRTVRESDLPQLYDYECDIESRGPYAPIGIPSESAFRRQFDETGFFTPSDGSFLICDTHDILLGKLVFFVSTRYFDGYEIAYHPFPLNRRDWNFITEALMLCTYTLFAWQKINRLELKVMPGDTDLQHSAERCGYQLEGTARGAVFFRGAHHDMTVYSILRSEAPTSLREVIGRRGSPTSKQGPEKTATLLRRRTQDI
jgi:ribosomal-protein-alanine N-acetyltransferase